MPDREVLTRGSYLDRLPIGTRVRLDLPGAWFHKKTGRVHHYPDAWPERVTVELDGGEGRALVHHEDVRVIGRG